MKNIPLLLVLAVAATSCKPGVSVGSSSSAPVQAQASTTDTLVGVVTEVGADPATWLSIRPSSGPSVRLSGSTNGMRNTLNAEYWISGERVTEGFHVDLFEVRKVNGQPVDDGVVSVDAGKVMVRTRAGMQREVPNAPPALRNMPGARVWISPAAADRAPSYGVIARP